MADGASEGRADQANVRANPDRAIQDDVIRHRLEFKDDPKQYRDYMVNLENGFRSGSKEDNEVLNKLELYDSKTSDVTTTAQIQALESNQQGLYHLLDDYHDTNHPGNFVSEFLFAPDGCDGKIGAVDLNDFISDAYVQGSAAYKYLQDNPQALDIVRGMPTGGLTISNLLDKQGFKGDNPELQFTSYYGTTMPKSSTDYGK